MSIEIGFRWRRHAVSTAVTVVASLMGLAACEAVLDTGALRDRNSGPTDAAMSSTNDDAPSSGMDGAPDAWTGDSGLGPTDAATRPDSVVNPSDAAVGSPVTLVCTGSDQTFMVPKDASKMQVWAWGAGGGGYTFSSATRGGGGAFAGQTFTVHPGDTWTARVGCAGTNAPGNAAGPNDGGWGFSVGGASQAASGAVGWLGGSGGGASALLLGSTVMLAAGGGGGAGGGVGQAFGGGGGSNGTPGGTCTVPSGGAGGGAGRSGENGGLGGVGYDGGGQAGQNGTALAGGNGGVVTPNDGDGLGGGGGGGYLGGGGGGGGGSCYGGGGGGGGSSYINTQSAVATATITAANGATPGNASDPHLPAGLAIGGISGGTTKTPGDGAIVIEWQ